LDEHNSNNPSTAEKELEIILIHLWTPDGRGARNSRQKLPKKDIKAIQVEMNCRDEDRK